VTGWLAAASLCIYLTHWLVHPLLSGLSPVRAVVVSPAAGLVDRARSMRAMGAVERRRTLTGIGRWAPHGEGG